MYRSQLKTFILGIESPLCCSPAVRTWGSLALDDKKLLSCKKSVFSNPDRWKEWAYLRHSVFRSHPHSLAPPTPCSVWTAEVSVTCWPSQAKATTLGLHCPWDVSPPAGLHPTSVLWPEPLLPVPGRQFSQEPAPSLMLLLALPGQGVARTQG